MDYSDAHLVYNSLPSLGEAEDSFSLEEQNKAVLKIHETAEFESFKFFAVTLVHRHTFLEPGEIMVSRGDITAPEKVEDAGIVYESAWLTTGDPYEYTAYDAKGYSASGIPSDPPHGKRPPEKLLRLLDNIVNDSNIGYQPLGIRYVGPNIPSAKEIYLEKTYGRASILTIIPAPYHYQDLLDYAYPSCWLVGADLVRSGPKPAVQVACSCSKDIGHTSLCADFATSEINHKVHHPTKNTTTTTTTKSRKRSTPPVVNTQQDDGSNVSVQTVITTDLEVKTKVKTTISNDQTTARTISTTTTKKNTTKEDTTTVTDKDGKVQPSTTKTILTSSTTTVTTTTDKDGNTSTTNKSKTSTATSQS